MKVSNAVNGAKLWHQMPGHASHEGICDEVTNNKVRGIHLKSDEMKKGHQFCEPCVEGKDVKKAIPESCRQ